MNAFWAEVAGLRARAAKNRCTEQLLPVLWPRFRDTSLWLNSGSLLAACKALAIVSLKLACW